MKKLLIILSVLLLSVSCTENTVSDSRIAMGTIVSVTLYESDDDKIDDIFSYIYSLDSMISRYNEKSYIAMINSNAGISPVTVPDEVYGLVKVSLEMAKETDGLFNPAIGPLSSLWGFGTEDARVPSSDEIESVLPLLDWRKIKLSDDDNSVFLENEGMAIDLGAVGKGWAADMIDSYLDELCVEHALVNLGGNVLLHGGKADGSAWRVGIRDPENLSSSYASVAIEDGTVITSGGYQRYIEKDGEVYHHILNPETGYPFQTDILSATVIGDSGTLSDMLSTVIFASGSGKAEEIADKHDVSIILKLTDGSVINTYSHDSQVAILEE